MTSKSAQRTKNKTNTLQRGRYSSNLLYNSSDDEDTEPSATDLPPPAHSSQAASVEASTCHQSRSHSTDNMNNPFENFTVKQKSSIGRSQSIRTSEAASGHHTKSRLPLSSTIAISGSCSNRFNPLGQVEGCVPALIPENEEEGGGERRGYGRGVDDMGDCPIIDDWLVDDMSVMEHTHPNKRKKQLSLSSGSSRKEVRSFLEGTSSNSTSASGGGRRKRPLQRKDKTTSQDRWSSRFEVVDETTYHLSVSDEQTSKRRKTDGLDVSSSNLDERFLNSVIITGGDLMDFDTTSVSGHDPKRLACGSVNTSAKAAGSSTLNAPRSSCSRNPTRPSCKQQPLPSHQSILTATSGHLPSSRTRYHCNVDDTSAMSLNQCHTNLPSDVSTTTKDAFSDSNSAFYSDLPPLRVKVKIESKSYLIPCLRKEASGVDTTVEWLISQASERHYAQQGLRPKLSLTTLDGALLCPSDPLVHVVSPNDEVVGVVEAWQETTLEESYQAACKNAGVGKPDHVSNISCTT